MRRSSFLVGITFAVFLVMSAFFKGCFCFLGCFVAGTQIATPQGPVAIETLRPGDLVWSYDHKTKSIVPRKVTKVWRFSHRPYRGLVLPNGQRLEMTENHPVYDSKRGMYIPVSQLAPDATLLSLHASVSPRSQTHALDQQLQPSTGAKLSWHLGMANVYTLTVEGTHNYFAAGLLVHNKSIAPPPCQSDQDCLRNFGSSEPICDRGQCVRCTSNCETIEEPDATELPTEPVQSEPLSESGPDASTPEIAPEPTNDTVAAKIEQPVRTLPLADGVLQDPNAEFSGLAWYKDHLILLPQVPSWGTTPDKARLFAITKQDILDLLDGKSTLPLTVKEIKFNDQGLKVEGFDGYESIAFVGDTVVLTIEAKSASGYTGYIIKGSIKPDLSEIIIDPASLQPLPARSNLQNTSDETLVITDDKILTIYEANGSNVTPNPTALVFGHDLTPQAAVPFPQIEYRITDATAPDQRQRFWAINYFFPGDKDLLKPAQDGIFAKHPKGTSHQKWPQVERLVEFAITAEGIVLTETPPIQLVLFDDRARNWEGLARLDDRGFLLITDKYPQTFLGFVAHPKK